MVRTIVCCDLCGIVLPVREEDTPLGKVEVVKTEKVLTWDISNVYPHLCRGCALSIDVALMDFKRRILKDD